MSNLIRFSFFGQYRSMDTSNTENYMDLIKFFTKESYKPSTANELIIENNAQPKVMVMPIFISEDGSNIEISSNRINFEKKYADEKSFDDVAEDFGSRVISLMSSFYKEFKLKSNRVALNYIETQKNSRDDGGNISSYFNTLDMLQNSFRNSGRKVIEKEMCNVILEISNDEQTQISNVSYDINTIQENTDMRFNDISVYFSKFAEVVTEIKKGLDKK